MQIRQKGGKYHRLPSLPAPHVGPPSPLQQHRMPPAGPAAVQAPGRDVCAPPRHLSAGLLLNPWLPVTGMCMCGSGMRMCGTSWLPATSHYRLGQGVVLRMKHWILQCMAVLYAKLHPIIVACSIFGSSSAAKMYLRQLIA